MVRAILRSPYFLSAVIIIAGYFIINPPVPKYDLKPTEHLTETAGDNQYIFANDFNKDGYSEFVKYKYNINGEPALALYDNSLGVIGQWNFKGDYNNYGGFYGFGDYDSNGFGEVYFLTINEESVILNFLEPLKDRNSEADSILVCHLKPGTLTKNTVVSFNHLADLDGDGFKEIIITVKAGYEIEPRAVFIINMNSRQVQTFSNNCNNIFNTEIFDIDNDNHPELFFSSRSAANSDINFPPDVNDNYVRAFVLDYQENEKFQNLIRFFSPHGVIRTFPFLGETDTLILGLANSKFKKDPILYSWDREGDLQDSLILSVDEYPNGWRVSFVKHKFDKELIIGSPNGYIYTLNKDLTIELVGRHEFGWRFKKSFDLNEDGIKEYIGLVEETILDVYSEEFGTKTRIKIPRVDKSKRQLNYSKYYYNGEPYLLLQNGTLTTCYIYTPNWLYWGQYLLVLLGILFLWTFTYLIQYQQRLQILQKQKARDEVTRLQFQAIANQINPHFSYNILNTIGYSVLNEDRQKAYTLLVKYSKLTRNLIEGGVKHDRTLQQEIGFVENYLELQKSRFEDSFNFFIEIHPDIDQEMIIPRMIILTFVENAIKHGLTPKEDNRILKIEVSKSHSFVQVIVEDNGVGRGREKDNEDASAGQGLSILDRIINIHKGLHSKDINYFINDLSGPDGTGTRVIISLEI